MSKSKPNIIFIVLDTHRVDRLGCYGYYENTTPNLDAFANQATIYERAISPAQWTIPSHASMFSGVYPAIHNTIQSGDALNPRFTTLAEHLNSAGYQTIGFCNNPLVGVLDNGFRRGFDKFFNYGGTIPSIPSFNEDHGRSIFTKIKKQYFRIIDRIATPIQQAVAASPEVLRISLNPLLVPLWTKFSNFKGDTEGSIQDTTNFIQANRGSSKFIFLNLMGTHLPYAPPKRFIKKFAPILIDEPAAQEFMSVYNTQALKWLLPLEKPYPELESQTLNKMYDAEVAYQDSLLNQLLRNLSKPEHFENSIVVIVGDHGEMLGEHQIMGHGLGVHKELIHVPLIIRFPGQNKGHRIKKVVSTTQVFHTILEAAGFATFETPSGQVLDPALESLRTPLNLPSYVFSEAYPPNNLLMIMEKYAPELISRYHCRSTRWAVYNQPYKLIRTENVRDEVYHYIQDPRESKNIRSEEGHLNKLQAELDEFLESATNNTQYILRNQQDSSDYSMDEKVLQRLRNLGYIE